MPQLSLQDQVSRLVRGTDGAVHRRGDQHSPRGVGSTGAGGQTQEGEETGSEARSQARPPAGEEAACSSGRRTWEEARP